MNRLVTTLLLLSALSGLAMGDDHYCSSAAGGAGAGTEGDPWDWTDATTSGNVDPGDTVYVKGTFGDLVLSWNNAVGTEGNHILYTVWPAESNPTCTKMANGGGTGNSIYVTFQNFDISPGGGTVAKPCVSFSKTHNVTYDNCNFTGNFNSNIAAEDSDYYPQYLGNDNVVTTQNTQCNNITFTDCTFSSAFRFIQGQQANDWLISNCTFDTMSEDSIAISPKGNNEISGCTFTNQEVTKGSYHWPKAPNDGIRTGDWTGQEYNAVIQDNTLDTGLVLTVTATKISLYANRSATVPDKTTTDIWRLVSDPNIYFDPNGNAGDGAHQDFISIAADVVGYTTTISGNRLTTQGVGGQGIILSDSTTTDSIVNCTNNIIIHLSGVSNAVLQGGTVTSNWYNNIIDTGANTNGMTINGNVTCNLYNNIIGGITTQSGTITSDYNIWQNSSGHGTTLAGEGNGLYSQDFSTGFFTNYASQDYTTLDGDAPQVDIGDATYAPADDFIGTSRPQGAADDAGAYEFIAAVVGFIIGLYE